MNNNQTTAEDTTTEKTVTTPSESTTTTTSDSTVTDEKVTDATVDDTADTTTTGDVDGVYNNATASGPFVLKETFNAVGSVFTVESGDTFTATDINTVVSLNGNRITNNDAASAFLRATNSQVAMTLSNQVAEGDIILDSLSTLTLTLSNQSYYMGIVNHANSAKSVSVSLDATSQLILAGDSYIDALENADSTNQNIYSNGYKLYVAGSEVAVNGSEAPETPEVVIDGEAKKEESEEVVIEPTNKAATKPATDYTPFIVGGAALLVIILAIVAVIFHNKKKKGGPTQGDSVVSPDGTMSTPGAPAGGRPDFSAFDDGPIQPAQPQQPQAPQTPSPVAPEPTVAPAAPATPQSPETPPRPRPPLVGAM